MEPLDVVVSSVFRSNSINYDIRNIWTLAWKDCILPEIPKDTPVPFRSMKTMWCDTYGTLTELLKKSTEYMKNIKQKLEITSSNSKETHIRIFSNHIMD